MSGSCRVPSKTQIACPSGPHRAAIHSSNRVGGCRFGGGPSWVPVGRRGAERVPFTPHSRNLGRRVHAFVTQGVPLGTEISARSDPDGRFVRGGGACQCNGAVGTIPSLRDGGIGGSANDDDVRRDAGTTGEVSSRGGDRRWDDESGDSSRSDPSGGFEAVDGCDD